MYFFNSIQFWDTLSSFYEICEIRSFFFPESTATTSSKTKMRRRSSCHREDPDNGRGCSWQLCAKPLMTEWTLPSWKRGRSIRLGLSGIFYFFFLFFNFKLGFLIQIPRKCSTRNSEGPSRRPRRCGALFPCKIWHFQQMRFGVPQSCAEEGTRFHLFGFSNYFYFPFPDPIPRWHRSG